MAVGGQLLSEGEAPGAVPPFIVNFYLGVRDVDLNPSSVNV